MGQDYYKKRLSQDIMRLCCKLKAPGESWKSSTVAVGNRHKPLGPFSTMEESLVYSTVNISSKRYQANIMNPRVMKIWELCNNNNNNDKQTIITISLSVYQLMTVNDGR